MHDIALFVSNNNGWKKLASFGSVELTDIVAINKAVAAARKDANNWSSHYKRRLATVTRRLWPR